MKLKNQPSDEELKKQANVISAIKHENIDVSDIPILKAVDFKNAVFNPYFKPIKKQITVRLDGVLIDWLKSQGRGYQTRLNKIIMDAMLKDNHKKHA
jgi:uncharacterized protein (DUF4415 family)